MESAIFLGIALHALGGLSSSTCYVSQKGTPNWSWQTYWLVNVCVAWFFMPVIVASITIPNLWEILTSAPRDAVIATTLLGAVYGFGGMAFAMAIRYIGFSMTYAIAIGISAVLGTVVPAFQKGILIESFQKEGGMFVLLGLLVSIVGIGVCGRAGFMKEKEIEDPNHDSGNGQVFDMKKGLVLVIIAGVLSAVFGISLSYGEPIDAAASAAGASASFAGYAKYIFATGGALLTNLIWWGVVHFRAKTFSEFVTKPKGGGSLGFYYAMGILGGVLWFGQFILYEQGHIRMGNFKFISWGIHMAMLIFFSFSVGLILKEWSGCKKATLKVLFGGLAVLMLSFVSITYGSWAGEKAVGGDESSITTSH